MTESSESRTEADAPKRARPPAHAPRDGEQATDSSADSDPPSVTILLSRLQAGDAGAAAALWDLVYAELHDLARRRVAGERAGATLQPTMLVHETFLRLHGDAGASWDNRAHFFASAATAMRRVLVDRARRRSRLKRGGGREGIAVDAALAAATDADRAALLDLDAAMQRLEAIDEQMACVVTMRYLLGCTIEETADAMGVSPAKVKKDWTFARAWLRRHLDEPIP